LMILVKAFFTGPECGKEKFTFARLRCSGSHDFCWRKITILSAKIPDWIL